MRGSSFFLHGHGGTGKTYLYNCTISKVRSRGQIALVVASLGIVAALLPDGLTAHSRFKILLNVDHSPTCMVKKGMTLAELLKAATLIVWDEAPMVHRLSFEVVDRTLCDSPDYQPFGGKTILLGGDFRQTLPVVPNGGCEDNINASLPRSSVWNHCTLLQLSINMRINDLPINNEPILDGLTFSQWVLSVGNGVYPDFTRSFSSVDYVKSCAIVTPTNAIVSEINDFMLNQIPGELQTYFSADSLTTTGSNKEALEMEYHIEFLNSLSFNGIPEHDLKLKPFSTVMLLRNLNPLVGLCNGTQILLTNLGNHLLQGLIVGGTMKDSVVAIPCIVLDVKDGQ
ncbi:ATP-dependent DNA helicase pif1 [Linum perenne]